jgi:hypothetical protein
LKSIEAEIDNLEQPGVLTPIRLKSIPKGLRRHIIGVYMFHKEKFKADGSFDKDKCRIVLLSNLRDQDTIGDSTSPTVNPISVMTQLNLTATRKHLLSAYDIKGAFLMSPMQEGTRMFIRVNPDVAAHWIARYPERMSMLEEDGCLYFELKRYVYGLHEASNQFNGLLDKHLKELGFKASKADPCLYTKLSEDGLMILSVHVDDMLLTSPNEHLRQWFEESMGKHFTLVHQRDEVSYLGMMIRRDKKTGSILVNQTGFLQNILKKHGCDKLKKFPSTPATDKLVEDDGDSLDTDKHQYLSLAMTLMYLARFTRPDILMPVSYLASKCSRPTASDHIKLIRVVRYLAGTASIELEYKANVVFKPVIFFFFFNSQRLV